MIEQLSFGTGGPNDASQLYAELRFAMAAGMTVEAMRFYVAVTEEGTAHAGMSALIDLIAMRPR